MKIGPISTLTPQLLVFWVVMNIINRGALHVCLPLQVCPLRSECCRRGAPTNVALSECNVEKNLGLKGFKLTYTHTYHY